MGESLRKAYEITDAKISFVSLVDKAANLRTFLLRKSDDGKATFSTYGRIIKADPDTHHVTGVVYEPMAEDSQGNYMTEDEITKAAYWFAKNSGKVDIQHSFKPFKGGEVVESWVAKADFSIEKEQVKKGTWLMTVEVNDPEVWQSIEKGEITGFSMGGTGTYSEEDVDLETVSKQETGEKKGLMKQLARLLGFDVVEKGAVAELYEKRSKNARFWEAFHALEDTLRRWDNYGDTSVYETDADTIRESLEDFGQIITELLTSGDNITKALMSERPVDKAGKKMSGKNRETLSGIYESLGAFLKEFDDPEDDPEKKKEGEPAEDPENPENDKNKEDDTVNKQDIQTMTDALTKAVGDAIAKALGTSQGQTEPAPAPAPAAPAAAPEALEKNAGEITAETVQKMVAAAVEKATAPQQGAVSMEQLQAMIDTAVAKAVDPIFKSKGLPSNLGTGTVEKQEEHYLHGLL